MSFTPGQSKSTSIPIVGEDVRAKRVWLLLNVMFLSWAFFLAYFCYRGYPTAARVCTVQFLVFAVIHLLLRRKQAFLLVMNLYLICSGIGIFSVAVSHPNLVWTVFFFPVSILVASNLFGIKHAAIWFLISVAHFFAFFTCSIGIAETLTHHIDALMLAVGTSFCTFFCCQQAEAGFQSKTKGLLSLSQSLQLRSEELERLATTDSLTGLMNRFKFKQDLGQTIENGSDDTKLGLFLVDMDGFKEINDTLGHAQGDEVLIKIGNRLLSSVGGDARVYRLGGDEFCILFEGIECPHEAAKIANRIFDLLVDRYEIDDVQVSLGASVGYAFFPSQARNDADLLAFADTAMYHAKRNQMPSAEYESEMTTELLKNRETNELMTKAVERNEFRLHYQPLFDAKAGTAFGAEALLRWEHEGRTVSAANFIPALEATGQIIPVSRWLIDEACRQQREWRDQGYDLTVSINISALQFKDAHFLESIIEPIKKYDVSPKKIDLEITEGILIENVDQVTEKLLQLKELGCHISIDDFGTGYSSLAYLRQFPLDKLKIDRAFVKDIPDSDDGVIATGIIMLANLLGLEVLAEGIETEEQLKFLRKHGCDQFQGYYFAKPTDPKTFIENVNRLGSVKSEDSSLARIVDVSIDPAMSIAQQNQ